VGCILVAASRLTGDFNPIAKLKNLVLNDALKPGIVRNCDCSAEELRHSNPAPAFAARAPAPPKSGMEHIQR